MGLLDVLLQSGNGTPAAVAPPVAPAPVAPPTKILVIDIGGTKVKILARGQTEARKTESGKTLTPTKMVESVKALSQDWDYEAIALGYPGLVGQHGPRAEPGNLGPGWVGFDFAAAFGLPVRIVNDAAMQALGSYEGGRMLFLGLGTGLGSALIVESVVLPLELGCLPFTQGVTLGQTLGKKGLDRLGKDLWREAVRETVAAMSKAFVTDYVVLGGGNSKRVKELPPGARLGHNLTAFRGGFRAWNVDSMPTQSADGDHHPEVTKPPAEWRVI